MEAVVLAAGEGSRLERAENHLPKLFIDICGTPLYEWQLSALDPHCDRITVMLGHGFEEDPDPAAAFDIPPDITAEVEFEVLADWDEYENGYTAREAIEGVDDHVLLVCGDVIFAADPIDRIVSTFTEVHASRGENVVGAIEGIQDEMTAITLNEDGGIAAYGAIEGHQEVGLFVLNRANVEASVSVLGEHLDYWFPVIFQETPSYPVFVSETDRHEINTRAHLREAREKFCE